MFHKYEYAYMLYREGSFTRAAEKLFISQPSLSVAIRGIEKELGAELFERAGSGVSLTEAGKEYIAAIEQVIRIEKELKNKIHDMNCLESGSLSVAGSNFISSYVLPGIINEFTRRHPKIKVELAEGNSHNLAQMLRGDQVDIIIDNYRDHGEYKTYPLAQEKILLCVPKGSGINAGMEAYRISPGDIYSGAVDVHAAACAPMDRFRNERFILLKHGNDMYERARGIFEENSMDPQVAFYVDQLNMAHALAASGNGVTFVTDTLFRYGGYREDVWLYNVPGAGSRTLYIAHRRNKYCTRAMTEFIQVAKEAVR